MGVKYDSKADTLTHIKRVNELLIDSSIEMLQRAKKHDTSKLGGIEKELFDEFTPNLADTTYGSDEYFSHLQGLKPALINHYAENSHHPEFYPNGIEDMDMFDILEMLLDWKAASEHHKDGDIFKSIKINKERFNYGDELFRLLYTTAERLWGPSTLTEGV